MRSFHLLVNPTSGGGTAPASVVPVARILREAGAGVEVTYSTGPVECRTLVARAVESGQVMVAVGGDGMVASLAGPVVEAGGVLGIVPSGRGNDFARQLGLAGDPATAARTLMHTEPRAVDVIDVGGQVVAGSVYAGVDSLASQYVDRAHLLPGPVQYPCAAVRAVLTFRPSTYHVVVDGVAHRQRAFTVVVANSGYYGSGMHIAPGACLTDGMLDVVMIRAASRPRLIRALPKLYDGSHVELDEVLVCRGREITVSTEAPVTAYADGERLAPLPLTAHVRPEALRVLA
ncbi:MAG TPA: diacylglycerol kinase family protein [Nocardioidaceae bacterium]|nr:diacylglycerol kinase family protein [Nocardioidaceae bacterium]